MHACKQTTHIQTHTQTGKHRQTHTPAYLLTREGLFLDEGPRQQVELILVLLQDALGVHVRLVCQPLHLGVNGAPRVLAVGRLCTVTHRYARSPYMYVRCM